MPHWNKRKFIFDKILCMEEKFKCIILTWINLIGANEEKHFFLQLVHFVSFLSHLALALKLNILYKQWLFHDYTRPPAHLLTFNMFLFSRERLHKIIVWKKRTFDTTRRFMILGVGSGINFCSFYDIGEKEA